MVLQSTLEQESDSPPQPDPAALIPTPPEKVRKRPAKLITVRVGVSGFEGSGGFAPPSPQGSPSGALPRHYHASTKSEVSVTSDLEVVSGHSLSDALRRSSTSGLAHSLSSLDALLAVTSSDQPTYWAPPHRSQVQNVVEHCGTLGLSDPSRMAAWSSRTLQNRQRLMHQFQTNATSDSRRFYHSTTSNRAAQQLWSERLRRRSDQQAAAQQRRADLQATTAALTQLSLAKRGYRDDLRLPSI